MKSYLIEEEGVEVVLKDNEITKDSISFRLSENGEILPYFCSARRVGKKEVFIFVQFSQSEQSEIIYVEEHHTTPLLDLLPRLVQEALELIEHHNLLGEPNK